MAAVYIPTDIVGLDWVEQVSWAAGDPGTGETALRARNIKFDPLINIHSPGYMKPEACRGPDAAIVGGEGGVLTFELALRGGAGSESEVGKLISNCGMTRHARASGAAKIKGTPTSTTFDALTTDVGAYVVGDLVCVGGASTDTQIRMITRVQDDNPAAGDTRITVSPNFSDTPVATDSFYAMDSFTPAVGATKYTTFYLWQGQGSTDRFKWVLAGCAGTFKIITTNADSLPYVEFTFQVDNWTLSEASTTTSADSFNPAHPLLGDVLTTGTATATLTESFAFDPGIKLSPIVATSGTHGRAGWIYHGVEPKIEVVIYPDIDDVNGTWATASTFAFNFNSIKDTDEFWAFHAEAVQMTKFNLDTMSNEHLANKPDLIITDPGLNADDTNYPLFVLGISGSGT